MKIAIYTIAKNEQHNVAQFIAAAEGADVYVLDTGSTDNTVSLLKEKGANVVQKIITPWRFDTARNEALNLVPLDVDICVSLDMDEVIESGWQVKLQEQVKGNLGNYRYIGEWYDKEKTQPSIIVPRTRIHSRHGFTWTRRIHEVIKPKVHTVVNMYYTDITVKHYQDDKQRNYTDALTELLKEDPSDLDARLQRAGEMFQKKKWKEALEDYKLYLNGMEKEDDMISRSRKATCCVAMGYCFYNLGDFNNTYRYFLFSVANDPLCREGWVNLANLLSQTNNVPLAYGAAMTGYSIKNPLPYTAIEGMCWSDLPKKIADDCFAKLMEGK